MLPIQSFVLLVSMVGFFTKADHTSLGSNDGYIFTMPNTVWAGRREHACLSMYGKLERSKANVTITVANTVTKILTHAVYPECFQVNIPQTAAMNARIQLDINFLDHPGYSIHKVNKLHFNQPTERIFIQTDRTTYKPGDLVKIRILLFKNDLSVPKNLVIPTVRIRNPLNIVVAQWNDVLTEMGLVQLEHQLSEETTLGTWIIELAKNENSRKTFEVKEYVLPRFDVTINHANHLYARQKSYNFTVCSKYTYGAPLKGTARLKFTSGYRYQRYMYDSIIKDLERGCSEFIFNDRSMQNVYDNIDLLATVTEQGTGQIETKSKTISLSSKSFDLNISPNLFQPGIPFKGIIDITGNSENIINKTIDICSKFAFGSPNILNYTKIRCQNFPIIDNKRTEFVIFPFRDNIHSIHITAKIGKGRKKHHTVNRWYSPSNSYIQISHDSPGKPIKCQTWHPFTIIYTLPKYASKELQIEFHYLIKSKGDIVQFGKIYDIPNKASAFKKMDYNNAFDTKFKPNMFLNKFTVLINIDQKLYSEGELLVYYVRKDGEIVSSSIKFNVENCLANKVDAGWQESQVYPGDLTTFNIKASRGSLCAVSAVDKATHLLSPASNINIEMLLKDIPKTSQDSRHNEPNTCKKPDDNVYVDYDDYATETYYTIKTYHNPPFHDTFNVLHDMQLLVITNLTTLTKPCIVEEQHIPRPTPAYYEYEIGKMIKVKMKQRSPPKYTDGLQSLRGSQISTLNKQIFHKEFKSVDMGVPVRSYFPETWLFDLVHVGDSGETNFNQSIPHTITQWIGDTYCVSPSTGVGVAPTSYITSFKPFFVDLLTPYAIKRNEVSHLKVIAFNYLNHSLPIKISLDLNENLQLAGSPRTFTTCLGPSDSETNEFKVTASVDGRMNIRVTAEVASKYPSYCKPPKPITGRDVIIKNILVHVEGFPIEETNSSYVCLNEHSTEKNIRWDMSLPAIAVPNYSRINILLDADFMELTVGNVGSLLKVPTGCGEQIMSKLAPNLYILQYLKALDKLTPEIQEKSYNNIRTGYERILQYRHKDGSFSVFGEGRTKSSLFLTSFVMRVLAQSSKYVFIDRDVIDRAQSWIMGQQNELACFSQSKSSYYRDDSIFLTAYVVMSFIDTKMELSPNVQDKFKRCLTGINVSDKFQLATSAYALLLAGESSEGNRIVDKLLAVSNTTENLIWWEIPYSTAKSVETTAYAILALIASKKTEHKSVADAAVRWLLTKRNADGGFISTQDTVVALDALTHYALKFKSADVNLAVTITTDKAEHYVYNVTNASNPKNIQLSFKQFKRFVNIKLKGTGCILVQNTLRYNMPVIKSNDELKLEMDVEPVNINNGCTSANVTPCVAFSVPNKNIDMAVLELSLPSGYRADPQSLNNLLSSTSKSKFKRFELKEDKVILYYSELDKNTVCTPFLINEQSIIENRTASIVRIYDYYNPIVSASKSYEIPQCVKPTSETI